MSEIRHVELSALPKVEPDRVRLLWVNDWYDGPVEAMVEHAGEHCLMLLHDERAIGSDEPLRWILVRLTPEQRAEEERWHALFARHVGEHWCMHPDPHPTNPGPRDTELFYRPFRERSARDFRNNDVLGWLDEMPRA